METLCRGSAADRNDIIDFGNYVFSFSHEPHDFVKLVPRLYGEGQSSEPYHYLIKENGRIKAMLCAYPMQWQVGEQRLKMSFIGTVSVHPYARGKGYMKRLMAAALEDMKREGCVFSALSGLRHRYRYFGYEVGGVELCFRLNQSNLRHGFQDGEGLKVSMLKASDVGEAYKLFERRRIHGVRGPEEFFLMLHNWNSVPYGLYRDGALVGYGVVDEQTIHELVLDKEALLPEAIKGLMASRGMKEASLCVPAYSQERISLLSGISEECAVQTNCNFQVFDYAKMIGAYLPLRGEELPLEDGAIRLEIDGNVTGISVKKGLVKIGASCAMNAPILRLSTAEAVSFLTAPVSGKRMKAARELLFLRSWFPLPLYIDSIDAC